MGEGRTEGAQPETEYVSVGDAAEILGVHRNTVRNRIKSGRIRAHKVIEGDKEVYRVALDSLGVNDHGRTSAVVHNKGAHRTTGSSDMVEALVNKIDQVVQQYTRELGDIREQLGAERTRREQAEEKARASEQEAERLREELEAERSKGFWRRLFGG
jgi:excisionase family DNA binding protein